MKNWLRLLGHCARCNGHQRRIKILKKGRGKCILAKNMTYFPNFGKKKISCARPENLSIKKLISTFLKFFQKCKKTSRALGVQKQPPHPIQTPVLTGLRWLRFISFNVYYFFYKFCLLQLRKYLLFSNATSWDMVREAAKKLLFFSGMATKRGER